MSEEIKPYMQCPNILRLLTIIAICISFCSNTSAADSPQAKAPQAAQLFAAVILGDGKKKVARLIADDADLTVRDESGMTPFLAAAAAGNLPVVRLLMKAGCDVNALDNNGNNALLLAVKSGSHETVRFFLEQGIYDINSRNSDGVTSLMIAAKGGGYQLLHILLAGKADSRLTDNKGCSLHMMAASSQNLSLLRTLIEEGNADINATDSTGRPLLSYAMHSDEMARYLIETGANISRHYIVGEQGYQNINPFIDAVINRNWQAVRSLLQKGADINQSGDYGVTPALAAGLSQQWELLEYLGEHGGRMNARLSGVPADKGGDYLDGADSILLAAMRNREELVCRMVAGSVVPVNNPSAAGVTPLVVAIARELGDMEACLRKAGAELDDQQKAQMETMRIRDARETAVDFFRRIKSTLESFQSDNRPYPTDASKLLENDFEVPEGVQLDYKSKCRGTVCGNYLLRVLSETGKAEFSFASETGKMLWREPGSDQWQEMTKDGKDG